MSWDINKSKQDTNLKDQLIERKPIFCVKWSTLIWPRVQKESRVVLTSCPDSNEVVNKMWSVQSNKDVFFLIKHLPHSLYVFNLQERRSNWCLGLRDQNIVICCWPVEHCGFTVIHQAWLRCNSGQHASNSQAERDSLTVVRDPPKVIHHCGKWHIFDVWPVYVCACVKGRGTGFSLGCPHQVRLWWECPHWWTMSGQGTLTING